MKRMPLFIILTAIATGYAQQAHEQNTALNLLRDIFASTNQPATPEVQAKAKTVETIFNQLTPEEKKALLQKLQTEAGASSNTQTAPAPHESGFSLADLLGKLGGQQPAGSESTKQEPSILEVLLGTLGQGQQAPKTPPQQQQSGSSWTDLLFGGQKQQPAQTQPTENSDTANAAAYKIGEWLGKTLGTRQ